MFDKLSAAVVATPEESIASVLGKLDATSNNVRHSGIAVILGPGKELCGVVTDGDIRRAYEKGIALNRSVDEIMTKEPITALIGTDDSELIADVCRKVQIARHLEVNTVRYVVLVDRNNCFVGIFDFFEKLWRDDARTERVIVCGLGFVGLTVAVALANVGFRVTGIEKNQDVVQKLAVGNSHIFEAGLQEMLRQVLARGQLDFSSTYEKLNPIKNTFVIAVGTPIGEDARPKLDELSLLVGEVGAQIKRSDQVIVRSTVPVGSTSGMIRQELEQMSGLTAGVDFNLSFCPERTVAGAALEELKNLPQLVGGLTSTCTQRGVRFWSQLCSVVIPVAKPEIAELAKLANNSFRDLTFAFANQVALISEKFNIPVDIVIDAANHGYPRNTIPSASPGVGGYCLTKDPYIMASSLTDRETAGSLGPIAREINIIAGTYPIKAVEKYLRKTDAKLFQADILIIGLAFKGYPETNDVRGSSGVLVAKALKEKGAKVLVWDHVLTMEEILSMGLTPADDYHQAVKIADIIIVMNNHPSNVTGLISDVVSNPKPRLVFDGWSQLNRSEMESITGLTYSTIGYMAHLGE